MQLMSDKRFQVIMTVTSCEEDGGEFNVTMAAVGVVDVHGGELSRTLSMETPKTIGTKFHVVFDLSMKSSTGLFFLMAISQLDNIQSNRA